MTPSENGLSTRIATTILSGFERHFRIFSEITRGARRRFENGEWQAEREAARERIQFYDSRVRDACRDLETGFQLHPFDSELWFEVKRRYVQLIGDILQPELAETFYNSVFCRLFHRDYFGNDYIFLRSAVATEYIDSEVPSYHVYYPARRGLRGAVRQILLDTGIDLPWEDLARDARRVTRRLIRHGFARRREVALNFQFQVLASVFYRNKTAYIVGRVLNFGDSLPFAIPILRGETGSIYCDALIPGEAALARLFEYSYVYFMVDHPVPSSIVGFLRRLMPTRSKESCYSAIGFHKQGKTYFYRDFLHHLRHSEDQLVAAPGVRGMVMAVFTLPSYPYVFKVIRDRFPPAKKTTRQAVQNRYRLVKMHDRAGRMTDVLEYKDVALPRERFADELLAELQESCANSVSDADEMIVLAHLYIERRMTPLNIAVKGADEETLDRLMKGYGDAIRELAAVNIFPGDLLMKNFGVTGGGRGRVVLYDYDEISYLTECNFRALAEVRSARDERAAGPWFGVAANDIFPEQFDGFLFSDARARNAFLKYHRDLLSPGFWTGKQNAIRAGVLEDIFPYRQKHRFCAGGLRTSKLN